jgi:hypothetical protein
MLVEHLYVITPGSQFPSDYMGELLDGGWAVFKSHRLHSRTDQLGLPACDVRGLSQPFSRGG